MADDLTAPRPVTPQPQQEPPREGQPDVPHRSREEHRQHRPDPASHQNAEEPRPPRSPKPDPHRETEGDS